MCPLGEAQRVTMTVITGVPCLLVVTTVECRLARGASRVCGSPSVLREPVSLEAPLAQVPCAAAHPRRFSPELPGMILK